jgi:hypothetical protein
MPLNKNLALFFIGILFIAGCGLSSPDLNTLKNDIQKKFDKTEGTFALAFINLADTSQALTINEREMFHAASTMKTPVNLNPDLNGQFIRRLVYPNSETQRNSANVPEVTLSDRIFWDQE